MLKFFKRQTSTPAPAAPERAKLPTETDVAEALAALAADRSAMLATLPARPVSHVGIN